MARTAYLHIGTMKSGTTYLQDLWELNREELNESGVLWPGAQRYQAVTDFYTWPQEGNENPSEWVRLEDEARAHPGDVVLSNEFLAAYRVRKVRRFVEAMPATERHVVITARDLARVIPSHWQTTVKNGGTQTWSEFAASVCHDERGSTSGSGSDDADGGPRQGPPDAAERFWRHHDLAAIIRRWRQIVRVDQITVVTVPPSGADPDTLAVRFGSVVGVALTGLSQPNPQSNASLGAFSAELLRRLNQQMTDDEQERARECFRMALGRSILAARAAIEPGYALTQDQHDWVSHRAERTIRQIKNSGVRIVGDLHDLVPAPHPAPGAVDPTATSDAELLKAAGDGLIGLAVLLGDSQILLDEATRGLPDPRRRTE